jgi:hypothetical protein
MDDNLAQGRAPGGTVEPTNRAAVAKRVFQTPLEPIAERYELHDPFAEVTYRLKSIPEIVAKADQLGSTRFQAIDPNGKRSQIDKVDGTWQRPDGRPLLAAREPDNRSLQLTGAPAEKPKVPIESVVARADAEAERAAHVARLEASLSERYVIKRAAVKVGEVMLGQTEYRYRGDASRVAFTESTFKLATDNNNPSVARSMVDVAEARNWQALRVSGNEDFKRMVWLEGSVRGVKTVGYEPQLRDMQLLQREREARRLNRIEPLPERTDSPGDGKASARGGGGRKAVLAALEAVLLAKRVPAQQRQAVMTAAADNLAKRLREGQVHKVKVFDKAAAPQRPPAVVPAHEIQRPRERTAPVR